MASRNVYVTSREVPPELQRRLVTTALVVFVAFALVAGRLWYLQVDRGGEMRDRSENNRIRIVRLPAARGVVYDRNGEILIDNRPSFDAIFVPEDARDRRLVLRNAAHYLGEDEQTLHQRVRGPKKRPPYEGIVLRRDVDWQGVVAIETHQLDLPAVSLQVAPKRYYPFGTLGAHLLGYVGEVSERELADGPSDYRPGDLRGKAGLESAWDEELHGRAGGQQVEADALSRRVRVLAEVPDLPGSNLTLTLDRDLQEVADRALGPADGAVVALDPRNGEVLVMVSHPAYDPNVFARGIRRDEWHTLVQDKRHPIANRAVQGQYPPGSTFKIAVATGALDTGVINPATSFSCGGGLQSAATTSTAGGRAATARWRSTRRSSSRATSTSTRWASGSASTRSRTTRAGSGSASRAASGWITRRRARSPTRSGSAGASTSRGSRARRSRWRSVRAT